MSISMKMLPYLTYDSFKIILMILFQVASYRPWVLCIIRNVKKGFRKPRVEKLCQRESGRFEKENTIE